MRGCLIVQHHNFFAGVGETPTFGLEDVGLPSAWWDSETSIQAVDVIPGEGIGRRSHRGGKATRDATIVGIQRQLADQIHVGFWLGLFIPGELESQSITLAHKAQRGLPLIIKDAEGAALS